MIVSYYVDADSGFVPTITFEEGYSPEWKDEWSENPTVFDKQGCADFLLEQNVLHFFFRKPRFTKVVKIFVQCFSKCQISY